VILLFVLIAVAYAYIAVAFTQWGNNEKGIDLWMLAAIMALWPVALSLTYVISEVRLRIKWRKYRGGRYLRKTFNAAAIDKHLAKYGHDDKVG